MSFSRRRILSAALAGAAVLAAPAEAAVAEDEETEESISESYWRDYLSGKTSRGPRHPNREAERALQSIAQPLFRISTRTNLNWRIGLLKVEPGDINACTPGGGVILVNDALIAVCRNETELLSVIGHEIGHVQHRHAIKRLSANKVFENYGIDPYLSSEEFRKALDANMHALVADAIVYRSYTRLWEHQADAFAVRVVDGAGHDARQTHTFFELLDGMYKQRTDVDTCLMSTHPLNVERINRMKAIAASLAKRPQPRDSQPFRDLVELVG